MPDVSHPVSVKKTNATSTGCVRVFLLIFLASGSFFLYLTTLRPLLGIWHAKNWVEVPCRILSSDVKSHDGGDGPTYSVAIRYAYQVNGQSYEADRYDFFQMSSSGYKRKRQVVDRYQPGSDAICYVNPNAPAEAVLQRGVTAALGWGLIPMVFVAIGLCAFLPASVFTRKAKPFVTTSRYRSSPDGASAGDDDLKSVEGPVELKAARSPRGKLIGIILIAMFWNGIVSVFVGFAWKAIKAGRPEWFLNIFLIPFLLVGLVLIGAVVHAFLNLFNPRLILQVSASAVPLGETLSAQWSFRGNTRRLRNLNIVLEGAERATYRRGTDTSTDEHVFVKLPLVETSDPTSINAGSGSVTIPADLMHSFKAQNNEIAWKLKVRGEIPRFPDVNEEYPLTVLPRPLVKS